MATWRGGRLALLMALWVTPLACGHPQNTKPSHSAPAAARGTGARPRPANMAAHHPAAPQASPTPPPERAAAPPFWVNPDSPAALHARRLRERAPHDAELLERLAAQPQGLWIGEWTGDVEQHVRGVVHKAQGQRPVFVLYNLPHRDCGRYSKGGLAKADAYRRWVRAVGSGLGEAPALVVLEPDALGLLDQCLTPAQQTERLALLREAVVELRSHAGTSVYLDAGHARWVPAPVMAKRLQQAGVERANGFALNTSNYVSTEENTAYGLKLSELLGGTHFVIDTGRNGGGPAPKDEWCNPPGRHVGAPPTTQTGNSLVDAWLWIKPPGESDGTCNGGPVAGTFWVERALQLAR